LYFLFVDCSLLSIVTLLIFGVYRILKFINNYFYCSQRLYKADIMMDYLSAQLVVARDHLDTKLVSCEVALTLP